MRKPCEAASSSGVWCVVSSIVLQKYLIPLQTGRTTGHSWKKVAAVVGCTA